MRLSNIIRADSKSIRSGYYISLLSVVGLPGAYGFNFVPGYAGSPRIHKSVENREIGFIFPSVREIFLSLVEKRTHNRGI